MLRNVGQSSPFVVLNHSRAVLCILFCAPHQNERAFCAFYKLYSWACSRPSMGAHDAASPAVASISFNSLSRQGRVEAVSQQSSQPSGNAYRSPAVSKGFQSFRQRRAQKPPGFLFNKQQQARRWLSGIGIGNGGFTFVCSSEWLLPLIMLFAGCVLTLTSCNIVLRCCVIVRIYSTR